MDNRPQILITGWMPKEGRDILEKYCDLDFCNSEKPLSKTELIQRAKNKRSEIRPEAIKESSHSGYSLFCVANFCY